MPRRPCLRIVEFSPPATCFKPAGVPRRKLEEAVLRADEMEAMRLVHIGGLYHADAALRMGISRQTLDRIIRNAHRVVTRALVEGQALRIEVPPKRDARKPRRRIRPGPAVLAGQGDRREIFHPVSAGK